MELIVPRLTFTAISLSALLPLPFSTDRPVCSASTTFLIRNPACPYIRRCMKCPAQQVAARPLACLPSCLPTCLPARLLTLSTKKGRAAITENTKLSDRGCQLALLLAWLGSM